MALEKKKTLSDTERKK